MDEVRAVKRSFKGAIGMREREVRWERMFPDELEQAFRACPVVYFTYGLCEPHGPHCALGLDSLKAHGIAVHAAQAHGGIVAPPNYWHVHEVGHYAAWCEKAIGDARPWLTSLPPWVHFHEVLYHIRTADALGFHAAIFITGHYGPNWKDLKRVCELMQPHTPTRLYGLPDFEANTPGFDGDGAASDHAGKVETSLLWALEPECVDMSRLPPPENKGKHFALNPNAHQSDRRIGERMAADEVRWLGAKAKELLVAYVPQPDHTPMTFARVEAIWEQEVRPQLPDFASIAEESPHGVPPEHSRWYPNWRIPKGYRKR